MITKEEFLQAIDIVNRYKIQLLEEQRQLEKVLRDNNLELQPLTRDTPLADSGLSARARNVLNQGRDQLNLPKVERAFRPWCLGDFEGAKLKDLKKLRNMGKVSLKEIQELFLQVGIVFE